MKKSILFIGALLIAAALGAVALQNQAKEVIKQPVKQISSAVAFDNNYVDFMNAASIPNIIFNIESRFKWEITKQDVLGALQIDELFPSDALDGVSSVNETRVVLIEEEGDKEIWGSGLDLNNEQQMLLKTLDYSTNFYVEAYCSYEDGVNRKVVYFHTIVPENQAAYEEGLESLISHIKNESRTSTNDVVQEKLKPGRISFTIDIDGKVQDLKKKSTSGYEAFDLKMLETIENLPSGWKPATDAEGKPVKQTLILFFGTQGC